MQKKKSRGVVGVPTNGDMLDEAVISAYLPECYIYREKNQGFLKISNFTPHDTLTSLAYIVKFELKVLSQSNELSQLLFRDSIKMNVFEIYA